MKRSLSLLLASLMLVFALTACGRSNDTAQDNGQNGTQSESAVTGGDSAGSGSTNGNSTNSGNNGGSGGNNGGNSGATGDANGNGSLLDDAGNAVEDGLGGMENAVDDMTGDTARNRTGGIMSR